MPPATTPPPPPSRLSSTECSVCLDSRVTHVFVPCGHACVCAACAASVMRSERPECPICRADSLMTMEVFVSGSLGV